MNKLPKNFDIDIYKFSNKDLLNLSNEDLIRHYLKYGYNENRKYKFNYDFSLYTYYILNNDLNNLNLKELKLHYLEHGQYEDREIKININKDINKINFIDYILWINLDRSVDRFNYMNNLLSNLDIKSKRIEAIDGNNLDIKSIKNFKVNRILINYEIACTLSHIKAINQCNSLAGNYFMICEDDISFDNLQFFNESIKNIILNCPDKNFDVLLLYKTYKYELKDLYSKWSDYYDDSNYHNNKTVEHIAGAVSYIISKNAINKFTNIAKYTENNTFEFINDFIFEVSDIFIFKNLNTYVYKYNYITTLINSSNIHNEHVDYQFECNKKEFELIKKIF